MSLDRTRSPTFSNERGPGAFVSLGSLPRRKSHPPVQARKSPVFHIHGDEDHEDHSLSSSDSPDEQTHTRSDSPIKNSPQDDSPAAVPFPCRSPSPRSPISGPSLFITPRPQLSRGSSTVLLSNGKPLKSSLKSSTSSLSIPDSLETQRPSNHLHLRSRSEPSTPTAQTPKNVHFPETDGGLASIRIFSRSARPTAVSTPDADETETEGEDQQSTGFPFPKLPPPSKFDIDPATTSVVPVAKIPTHANVIVESLNFSYASSTGVNPHLSGTILVRNLAYEKHVAVRFTLDDWQTVSEVTARHVVSLPSLPPVFALSAPSKTTLGDLAARRTSNSEWDRFCFMIRLEDYGHSLGSRVLWFAARYRVDSMYPALSTEVLGPGGEWWDNNDGENYRVAFKAAAPLPSLSRIRRETAPQPSIPSMVVPPPPTSREHARGLFVSPFTSPSNRMTSPSSSPTRDGKEKISLPLRSGKLRLPNYAAPPVRPASPASPMPAQRPHSPPSPSDLAQCPALQVHIPPAHDYESPSPASSTLSTPSASPNIVPRVIINGHPANYARPPHTETSHIDDWEWMAPPVPSMFSKRPSTWKSTTDLDLPRSGPGSSHGVPRLPSTIRSQSSSGVPGLPPGSDGLSGDSLYNAFVTRWCFAQGSAAHGPLTGGDGGILA